MKLSYRLVSVLGALILIAAISMGPVRSAGDHEHGHEEAEDEIDRMIEMHRSHDHAHDLEAMEDVSREHMRRVMAMMREVGLALPPMDSRRGRKLFLEKGCVVCHSVNGVGGAVGPSLNAADMPEPMNAFEFAARMWRGAPAMAAMQQDVLGEAVDLTGQELADIIAFAHDESEQTELAEDQVPEKYRDHLIR